MPRKPVVTISDEPFDEVGVDAVELPPMPDAVAKSRLVSYRSRIHVVDAWQYMGSLYDAPAFVDRNWAAWADYDDSREIPAGPALRVPTPGAQAEKLARPGDYVVRQEVVLAEGLDPEPQIDVWPKAEFERFFLPTRTNEPPDAAAAQIP